MNRKRDQQVSETAWKRARAKLVFRVHFAAFVVFNTLTVGIWLMTEIGVPEADQASFWPGWFIVFWLPALVLHSFWAYRRPLSELAREEDRPHSSGASPQEGS